MVYNASTGRNGSTAGGAGFNPLSAGRKRYGASRRAPNVGKTTDKAGYVQRDMRNEAQKNALIRWVGKK